ncbi:short-chain dehydrogenase/reductase SDR [Dyadobacter fermentans DSM 18053]|uniref:Short-chain dehydrogenase/reductase SDR n=2 Tax=Dyadobacter fermentans TaxID=94254 RepID=C6VW34_DYAFD|nr:short-chain dehydrogenase/reductase SDR [Dyadobacter fermentans DSM 18053]
MKTLKDKVAVVTGGNRGIGYSTAQILAEAGAKVVITGRDKESVNNASAELGVKGFIADQRKLETLDELAKSLEDQVGKIDVLFLNAGLGTFQPVSSTPEDVYDLIMDTNLKGTFFTVQKLIPLLNDGASVIFNASVTPILGIPGSSVYAASNAAIVSLARILSKELSDRKIRVNTVSPGTIRAGVHTPSEEEQKKNLMPSEKRSAFENALERRMLLKRYGTACEVGNAVKFLASDESSFVNGSVLTVDGGVTVDSLNY